MISAQNEVEEILEQIEANLNEAGRLAKEYERIPGWRLFKQTKNLRQSLDILNSNKPLWRKLDVLWLEAE